MPLTHKVDWTGSDFMTPSEMNRIEDNMTQVRTYLVSIYYNIPALTVTTNRTRDSVDYLSDINRIEQNLESIKNNFLTTPNYLPMKVWDKEKTIDFTDINRLELNTRELMEYAQYVFNSFRYCGTMNTGGGGLY